MSRRGEIEQRVAELRKSRKLEGLLPKPWEPPPELAQPHLWAAWLWFVPWTAMLAMSLAGFAGRPVVCLALGLVCAVLFWLERIFRDEDEHVRERAIKSGVLVRARVIMANEKWFEEGNQEPWPAWVLLSFHEPLAESEADMQALANRLFELKLRDRSRLPPDLALIGWNLSHEMTCENMLVPESFAGAPDTWACTTRLPPKAGDDDDWVWVLALPGEQRPGAVLALPRSITDG